MGAVPASRDVTSYGMGLAAPLALFFLLFFVAPLLQLFWLSLHNDTAGLHWGLGQYLHFLTDPFSLSVLGSTLLLGAEVTAVCLVLGFPIAWLYQRVGPKLQTIIILIVPTNSKVTMGGEIARVLAKDTAELKQKFVFQDWKKINEQRSAWIERFNREIKI